MSEQMAIKRGQNGMTTQQEALQALILDPDLERLEDLLADFNLFDVLGIARAELRHSAFLAWLLDPRGSHGLRDYFLRTFLLQVAREASNLEVGDITPFEVDSWKLLDIEVATERYYIDILIVGRDDGFVCLIENKIGSGEHSNQLSRYLDTVKGEYEIPDIIPIFLTPDGRNPDPGSAAEDYIPLGYGMIVELIERTLRTRGSTIGASVTTFLEQYARTLRRHVLDTTDNIDELASKIYYKHRTAIDLIINAQSNKDAMDWEVVESAVKQYAPSDFQSDSRSKSILRYFSSSLDEIDDLRIGQGWTASRRLLMFEIKHERGELNLYLWIGPGPEDAQEIRGRLKALADDGRVQGVSMRRSTRLGTKWHSLYRKPVLSREDLEQYEPDEARQKVEQALSEFYEKDYWPIVNAIREEFGLPEVSSN